MTTLTGPLGLSAKEGKMYLSWPFGETRISRYLNDRARWVWVCHDWCYGRRWIPGDIADELAASVWECGMGMDLRGQFLDGYQEDADVGSIYRIPDRREADAIMFTLLWKGRVYGFHDLPGYIAKPLAIVAWSHQRLFGGKRWNELREKENGR